MAVNNQPFSFKSLITVKKLTWAFLAFTIISLLASLYTFNRIRQIDAFNIAVNTGKTPVTDQQSFEAKFATALYLAKKERYKEATLLFTQALPKGNADQKSAINYNIGNMFFIKWVWNGPWCAPPTTSRSCSRQREGLEVENCRATRVIWTGS